MEVTPQQTRCDHHFGDRGEQQNCTKCGLDRDLATIVGKAIWRQKMQERRKQ